ncbi:hypothetical protein, partial [Enterococcus casseliflavus]|uniref:hypothetical protein n=1 Tax=Enterococcus casseliflavus TaxID=37734 RepID=UPI003D0A1D36
ADGVWIAAGVSPRRRPLVLAMLGDSSAAGYGVHVDADTPAARIATGLSALARRPVRLRNAAIVGAQTSDLLGQVEQILDEYPDVA